MKRDGQSSEPEDPLDIVQRLERENGPEADNGEASTRLEEIPADFELARRGLELIRRAAQADQSKFPQALAKGEPSIDFQQAGDTDRLNRAQMETLPGRAEIPPLTRLPADTDVNDSAIPRNIGRFQILGELGRGGFGVVLLGEDPALGRKVAIKVPRLEMLIDADARERFNREACLVSTLAHPAIVPVYEYSSGPGVPFIAFAWCRGTNLAEWLLQQDGKTSPRLAAQIASRLAGAIEYAHQRNVVHRDLKPANILLDWETGQQEQSAGPLNDEKLIAALRITDFGLAMSLQPEAQRLTRAGAMVGTPSYMAPEQFSGKTIVSKSADIYALGAILYELLTGTPPLRRDTDLATMRAVETEEPVSPGKLRANVPTDLEAICLKCLEKSPDRRYASAYELQEDLQQFLAGHPVSARRITKMEKAIRWCRRNPVLSGLTAATAAAVFLAALSSWIGWYSTRQALKREQAARTEADQAYEDAKNAIDEYFVAVSQNQLLTAPGLKTLRQELLQNAVAYYRGFIEKHQSDAHLARDLMQACIYRAMIDDELGNYPAAREGYETALGLIDKLRPGSGSDLKLMQQHGMILRKLARLDRQAGDTAAALAKIEQAMIIHHELLSAEFEPAASHGELGLLFNNRASIERQSGNPSEAMDGFQESEVHFQSAAMLDPANPEWQHQVAMAQASQAAIRMESGESELASQLLTHSTNSLRQVIAQNPDHLGFQMDLGKALANLALAQGNLGRHDDQLASFQEATQVFDRLAAIHPQVVMYQALRASTRRSTALLLNNMDRAAECTALAGEAIDILQEVVDHSPGNAAIMQELALTQSLLGRVWRTLGDSEKAREYLSLAIESLSRGFEKNPGDLYAGQSLAEAYQQLALVTENPAEAAEHLARAQQIAETLLKKWPGNPGLVGIQKVIEETRRKTDD